MSDPAQTPPKPKPGSLRDRIAAFEKPNTAATTAPVRPPAMRPKPGNISWKPAPPSPTSAAPSATTSEREEQKRGGMSASDAKESIGRGGSLKERMAALQGKGAFGGGSPLVPPPVGPKPLKRPPLVVPPPPAAEEENDQTQAEPKPDEEHGDVQRIAKEENTTEEGAAPAKEDTDEPVEPVEEEQDEAAKERERRAAIAARMARLGGTRVGMGPPPVIGKKPEVKPKPKEAPGQREEPKEAHKEESVSSPEDKGPIPEPIRRDSAASEVSATSVGRRISSPVAKEDSNAEIPQTTEDEDMSSKEAGTQASQSSLSTETSSPDSRLTLDASSSQPPPSTSRSAPTSMPLPVAPRRAGPPRGRSARNIKSPAENKEEEATTVHTVPSEVAASATSHLVPAETETEVEVTPANEESTHEEILASDPSVPEAQAEEEHATTAEDSGGHVTPLSPTQSAQDEAPTQEAPTQEAPKSPEDVSSKEHQERAREALTFSGADAGSPAEPTADDKLYISSISTLEQHVPEALGFESEEPDARAPRAHEPPATVVASIPEDLVHDETLPQAREEHPDETTADQAQVPSTAIEQSSSSPPITELETAESTNFQAITSVTGDPEQPHALTAEDETEEEEAARRQRIAERVAKMGGRTPFATGPFGLAASPPRQASIDEPQETASAPKHEEFPAVEKAINDDDIRHAREVITECAVSHEVEDLGPRVTSVAVEQSQDKDVPVVEAPLEEHEETGPEHKISPELLTPQSEDYPVAVSLPEQSSPVEGADDMAPPRITRPIPPPPPQAHSEDRAASPTAIDSKRTSVRRALPPAPQESQSVATHHADDAPTVQEKDEAGSNQESLKSDHVHASATILPSSPSGDEQQGEARTDSPVQTPTYRMSFPAPPRTVPGNTPQLATPVAQSPTSPVSGSSRRSIPPPVPLTVSPTSSRRAASPPARAPPTSPPRPVSPRAPSQLSPAASVRRSIPPQRRASSNSPEASVVLPPRGSSQPSDETTFPVRRSSSPSVRDFGGAISPESEIDDRAPVFNRDSIEEQEVLEDSEPDPIDPSFYSPPRSPITPSRTQAFFPSRSKESSGDTIEEDDEQARRRTIAERMAKLGGIKFGAPPPVLRKHSLATSESSIKEGPVEGDGGAEDASEETQEPESEEAERARRQAISARIAGMGGMRFGMLPQPSASVHPRAKSDESARTAEAHSPQQPQAPPPPRSIASDADLESEDGVKVEAESETSMIEVTEEDVVEEPEEIPPPIPSRANRQSHGEVAPPLPGGRRPPIPTFAPRSQPSIPSAEPVRKSTGGSVVLEPPPSEFVVVGDPAGEEEVPPPPPPRAARPPRSIPPPPAAPSASSPRDMTNSQWELPDIRTGSLDLSIGGGLGMGSSFTSEDSTAYPPADPSSPPRPAPRAESTPTPTPAVPQTEVQLSADELLQLWGVVGTAVHSAASALFDKSKKKLIGDGTSQGFVMAALAQVPQASKTSYGHLVYSQNAHAVVRRSSNVMPGDIIQLTEAKLKGHKGLQSYNQTVGTAHEPFVAIVSEFDAKRSKVKVFQANTHVGAQTVETASYRLEDLKSGNIKVFRVASA